MYAKIQDTVRAALQLIEIIPQERKELLEQFVKYVVTATQEGREIQTNTICTHNSRRSHLGQVWIQTMAYAYGIPNVKAFSGGTEGTACHPNTIAAFESQGFQIQKGEGENPVYTIRYADDQDPILCWSKRYDDAANPKSNFVAMMVCGSADGACPVVAGSSLRLSCTYVDPKVSDGTAEQDATYQARSLQIASEMAYVMARAAHELKPVSCAPGSGCC